MWGRLLAPIPQKAASTHSRVHDKPRRALQCEVMGHTVKIDTILTNPNTDTYTHTAHTHSLITRTHLNGRRFLSRQGSLGHLALLSQARDTLLVS